MSHIAKKLPFSYAAAMVGCQIVTREGLLVTMLGTIHILGERVMVMAIHGRKSAIAPHDTIMYYPVHLNGKFPTDHDIHHYDLFIRPKEHNLFKLIEGMALKLPLN